MGAGLSRERQKQFECSQLQKIKRELEAVGVGVLYKNYQLVHFENANSNGGGFNIRFNRMNASNGECCLYPVIRLSVTGDKRTGDWRGWWDANTYEKGLQHVKELFGSKTEVK